MTSYIVTAATPLSSIKVASYTVNSLFTTATPLGRIVVSSTQI